MRENRTLKFWNLFTILFLLTTVTLFIITEHKIYSRIERFTIPFDTDEADHANAALDLYGQIKNGDMGDITRSITRQAFYPPVHSLFTALSYFVYSPSLFSSRLPSLVFFILTGTLLFLLTLASCDKNARSPGSGLIGATATLLFFIMSPLILLNSALSMLELCGLFFEAILLLAIAFTPKKPTGLSLTIIGVLCFTVMLCKYSFGIIVIPGIIMAIFLYDGAPSEKSFFKASITGISFLILFGIWSLASNWESILHFFIGHPSYAPLLSQENIFFDLRGWLYEYSINLYTGILTLLLAIYGGWINRSLLAVKAASWVVIIGIVVLTISTTNETRHFIVAALPIWYLAGLGMFQIVVSYKKHSLFALIAVILALSPVFYGFGSYYPTLARKIKNEMEGRPEYGPLQEFIAANVLPDKPALSIGSSDDFSIESIQWHIAKAHQIPYTKVLVDSFPYRLEKNFTALKRARNLDEAYTNPNFPKDSIDEMLSTHYYKTIILIRQVGGRDETATLIQSVEEKFTESPVVRKKEGDKEVIIYQVEP